MSETDVLAALTDIFRENFCEDDLCVTRETSPEDIPDWDSLEQINLITAVEDRFGIKLTLQDAQNIRCVGDFAELILRGARS